MSNGSHWVTVTGYLPGTGPQDARLIGGRWVSEIHLNDPYEDDISSITVDGWFDEELTPNIIGGPYIDAVVVIADVFPGPHTGSSRHHTWHHTRAHAAGQNPRAAGRAVRESGRAGRQTPVIPRDPARAGGPWKTISASLPRAARR